MEPQIISIAGEPKSGKTHFACTAPSPIRFFDFDLGSLHVVTKKFTDTDIVSSQHYIDVWGQNKVTPIFEAFDKAYKEALKDDSFKTVVIDTGTQLWQMVRIALFEHIKKTDPNRQRLIQIEYGTANAQMEAFLRAPKASGKNLIITHYTKDAYDDTGNKTGFVEPDQYKNTNGIADILISLETVFRKKALGVDTLATIQASRENRDIVGAKLTNPTWEDIIMVAVS